MAQVNIRPTDLRDYAKAQGWQVLDLGSEQGLYVLGNQSFENRQLVFPKEASAPGYEDSVFSVVEKLASFSHQSPQRVADKVAHFRDDTLRVRVVGTASQDTELPLEFVQGAVKGIETMLKAAACSAVTPRPHHPRLAYSAAQRLVHQAKFGQTEPGSFIIKVFCPIYAVDEEPVLNLSGVDGPFVRRTMMGLWRAVRQIVDAAEMGTMAELFGEAKTAGKTLVSSNLCEALRKLYDDDNPDGSVELNVDWAAANPVNDVQATGRPIIIPAQYFPAIERLGSDLRALEVDRTDNFVGTVESLDGEMTPDGRAGEVTLALMLPDEGEVVRARTRLRVSDYASAVDAHKSQSGYVRVAGKLHPGRQPRQLTEVTSFEVLAPA